MENQVNGFVILNKPAGISSMQAVARVRRIFGVKKAGHGGTLDPFATGVLPIAMGKATKQLTALLDGGKSYRFTVEFGRTTDTLDTEGQVIETCDKIPSSDEIAAVLPQFTGTIMQAPPAFSAIKLNGKRAYDLARKGKIDDNFLAKREVMVYKVSIADYKAPFAVFEVECGKGFYVRSFGRDLAKALGTVGFIKQLERTAVGRFTLEDARTMEQLAENPVIRPV